MCEITKYSVKFVLVYTAYETASNDGLPAVFFPQVPNGDLETLSAGILTNEHCSCPSCGQPVFPEE